MRRVLLVTNRYPQEDSHEKGFVFAELKALCDAEIEVTLAPAQMTSRIDADLPSGVILDRSYAQAFVFPTVIWTALQLPFMKEVWRELRAKPSQVLKWRFWKESVRLAAGKRVFASRATDFDIAYTFWFTADTMALASIMSCPVITRAHGYDIYEELPFNGGRIPFRRDGFERIAKVLALSRQAADYLISRYNLTPNKVTRIPLGVPNQPLADLPDDEGVLVALSCSFVSPNKRIGTIGETLAALAIRFPQRGLIWHHIGGEDHQIGFSGSLPRNMKIKAWGKLSREEVLAFYRSNRISFFVNLSLSEGQPVSVMEAMSFGVPIVATAVGGVPEMLERGGGILVDVSDSPKYIAAKISSLIEESGWRQRIGSDAQSVQREAFSAQMNAERVVAFIERVVAGDARADKPHQAS